MEKRFTTCFMFAASLLMPFVLVGCGEEILPDGGENGGENPIEGTVTVFSGSKSIETDDGTRTSMNAKGKFFWEEGDYIWLDEERNGSFSTKLTECKLSTTKESANFYLRGKVLAEPKYDILYTGTVTGVHNKVSIAKEQTQNGWNDATHFGASGDCGVAEASNDGNGKYSFVVKHKAAYLILAPFLNTAINEECKLTKIEIISNNTIAGTYPFDKTNGIVTTSTIENPSDTITLNCTGNLTLAKTSSDACFVVLQPGEHTLTIKYTITSQTQDKSFTFVKEAFAKNFKVNGVTVVRHELTPMVFTGDYYKWGASSTYTKNGPYDDTTMPPTGVYTGLWASLRNANNMSWYVERGDPRWDGESPWILNTSTANVPINGLLNTGGVWFKKYTSITGYDGTVAPSGIDFRAYPTAENISTNESDSYRTGGKPTDISQYFFLPAAGSFGADVSTYPPTATGVFFNGGQTGYYWSKSPGMGETVPYNQVGVGLTFTQDIIQAHIPTRVRGFLVTPDWFQ